MQGDVMIITNAFSLNMIDSFPMSVNVEEITLDEARELAAKCESAVGHADTAAVFSSVLGLTVPANRMTVTLRESDSVLIGQYKGPRLPEGTTKLPEGATIQWLCVHISRRHW